MTLPAICTADRCTALGRELAGYLSCVASELPPRLAALSPSRAIDLAAQAERHRAGPLLRERLVSHGLLDALPATAREALEAQYLANSVRALSGYHELVRRLEMGPPLGIQLRLRFARFRPCPDDPQRLDPLAQL